MDMRQGTDPSDNADALIRAAVTPEARRVIRTDVLAEIVEWFEARSLGDEGEGLLHGLRREFGVDE